MELTKYDIEKIKDIIDCHIDELENEHSYAIDAISEMKKFKKDVFPKLDQILVESV